MYLMLNSLNQKDQKIPLEDLWILSLDEMKWHSPETKGPHARVDHSAVLCTIQGEQKMAIFGGAYRQAISLSLSLPIVDA